MFVYLSIYLGFLILVSLLYYSVKNPYKHLILFASSLGFITFISWKVALFALLFSIFNFYVGILIEKSRSDASLRRKIFWTGIALDIAFLAFFKYFTLLFQGFEWLVGLFSNNTEWQITSLIIPLGISYYTFQALGYIIRINRGSEKPQHDLIKFITFLIFFPKFFSGPVERSNHFFPQFNTFSEFNKAGVSQGFRLFLWGAFKKIVIAGSLFSPVQHIYSDVYSYTGLQLVLVFFIQTLYIYMEFSGYTDMALGSARILGINLIDNFNRPFLSRTISEFWRRWHISLSTWCNDFIYSPFIVKYRKYENFAIITGVFLTFFVIGIWHAANWTFVVLGLLQGIAIVYEFYTKKHRLKVASAFPKSYVNTFSRIIVFLFVCTSMVFFFSPSISDAWYFLSHMFSFNIITEHQEIIDNKILFFVALGCFILILFAEILNEKGKNLLSVFLAQPIWLRWISYGLLIAGIYFSDAKLLPFEYMKF